MNAVDLKAKRVVEQLLSEVTTSSGVAPVETTFEPQDEEPQPVHVDVGHDHKCVVCHGIFPCTDPDCQDEYEAECDDCVLEER